MTFIIITSSVLMSVVLLTGISYKWQICLKIGFMAGLSVGLLSGFSTAVIHGYALHLPVYLLVMSELFFIGFFTVLGIILSFYRDPERTIPQGEHVIVSPADGTVRYIHSIRNGEIPVSEKKKRKFRLAEMTKTDLLKDGVYLIGIEMSVLDVHVNRAPVEGEIIHQKPVHGKFLSLKDILALTDNERVTTIIDTGKFRIGIVQIASRLVRRIVSYLSEGEQVEKGQRIGMIKFGSQVDVVVPKCGHIEILVKKGDSVKAGSTILCELEPKRLINKRRTESKQECGA
jgi:phosphatidylserine decarboxylase